MIQSLIIYMETPSVLLKRYKKKLNFCQILVNFVKQAINFFKEKPVLYIILKYQTVYSYSISRTYPY